MNAVLQYVLYVGILVAISVPLGIYMSKVMDGETNIVSRVLGPVERGIYKLLRIDPNENMGWKKYLAVGLYGHPAQEAETHPGFSPVHPDPYRRGIPDGQGRVTPFRRTAPIPVCWLSWYDTLDVFPIFHTARLGQKLTEAPA